MDLVAHVMFDAQQEYFLYGMSVGRGHGGAVPDFLRLTNLVTTHRTDSLSGLPSPWYYKFSVLNGARERGNGRHTATKNPPAGSARSQSGSAVLVNLKDRRFQSCRDSSSRAPDSLHGHYI